MLVVALASLPLAAVAAPSAVYTNTSYVEALAADGDTLWAATRGGVERWDAATADRRQLYTTADGLAENAVGGITVEGRVVKARTARAACTLEGARWRCEAAPPVAAAAIGARVGVFRGRRVTAEVEVAGRTFLGTAGGGLWLAGTAPRRLTPDDQICSNHVVALAAFAGQMWFATFDEGLCRFDGRRFERVDLPITMTNDLVVAGGALYVASTRGLHVTRDGRRWRQVPGLDGRGVVDLASDGEHLWAATTASLWRLPLRGGRERERGWWQPGGSHALQAVDARGGVVWVATEDRGVLRFAGGRFQVLDRAAGLPSSWSIDVAATADGGAYVATLRDGLVRVEPDGASAPAAEGVDPWLLHVSGAGETLWVGTQGGAATLDTNTGAVTPLAALPHPSVHALAAASDGLWVGTEGGTAVYR
jgi:ligand-binding sensor domain-containing protein